MADLRNRMGAAAIARRRKQNAENFDQPKAKKGVKPLRGVRTEEEKKVRLWNLSDDPSKSGGSKSEALVVLSATVQPGTAVEISAVDFAASKRLQALVSDGRLFAGDRPPAEYMKAKARLRSSLPRNHTRRLKDSPERKEARAARVELRRASAELERVNKMSSGKEAEKAKKSAEERVALAVEKSSSAAEKAKKLAPPVPEDTVNRLSQKVPDKPQEPQDEIVSAGEKGRFGGGRTKLGGRPPSE